MPDYDVDHLLMRVDLMDRGKSLQLAAEPSRLQHHDRIISKIKELVRGKEIASILAVESAYNFLMEKMQTDNTKLENYAKEIKDFIL